MAKKNDIYGLLKINNNTNKFKLMKKSGHNKFDMKAGLWGLDLSTAMFQITVGHKLGRLVDKCRKAKFSDANINQRVTNTIGLPLKVAERYLVIYRAYPLEGSGNPGGEFKYCYVTSIPQEVLLAFAPHINKLYEDPTQGIGPNTCISPTSIEVYIQFPDGCNAWRDLKFMSLDDVKNLPDLVARAGLPPAPQQQTVQGRSNGQQSSGNQQVTPQQNEPQQGPHYDGQQAPYYDEEQPQYQQAPYYDEEQPQYQQPQYQQAPYHDEEHSTTQRGVQQPPQGNAAQGHQNKQDGTNRVGKARDDCSNQPFDLGTIEFKI